MGNRHWPALGKLGRAGRGGGLTGHARHGVGRAVGEQPLDGGAAARLQRRPLQRAATHAALRGAARVRVVEPALLAVADVGARLEVRVARHVLRLQYARSACPSGPQACPLGNTPRRMLRCTSYHHTRAHVIAQASRARGGSPACRPRPARSAAPAGHRAGPHQTTVARAPRGCPRSSHPAPASRSGWAPARPARSPVHRVSAREGS